MNNKDIIIIDIKDCFFHIIYHYKSLLLAAIIGSILVGGFMLLKTVIPHFRGQVSQEEIQYEQQLEEYQSFREETENSISLVSEMLNVAQKYKEESILYNSINLLTVRKAYFLQSISNGSVPSDQTTKADDILLLYQINLLPGCDSAKLKELFGKDELQYISEVVSLTKTEDSDVIVLQVTGQDLETAKKQLGYLASILETVTREKVQNILPHELLLINETISVEINENPMNNQKAFDDWIAQLEDKLNSYQKELDSTKKPVLAKTKLIKYFVVGFLFGGILMFAVYLICYVFERKLHTAKEMESYFSIPLYGDYPKHRANGKLISSLLDKWEFFGVNTDSSVVTNNICALLRETCKGKIVAITGTVSEKQLLKLQNDLQEQLEGDVSLFAVPEFLNHSTAINDVKKSDAVILVEEKHTSEIKKIERVLSVLSIAKEKVIGCIVL